MSRAANMDWNVGDNPSWDRSKLATLMDIRDELQTLNRVFRCHNFLAVPDLLRAIKKNTTKRKYKRKVKA